VRPPSHRGTPVTILSQPSHPRVPLTRNRLAAYDLRVIQRATSLVRELDGELEAQLRHAAGAADRLRLLRETANQITRTANDAVHAYRRANRSVDTELGRDAANIQAATEVRGLLHAARRDLLAVLDSASRHYPSAEAITAPAAERTGRDAGTGSS
jgi:hypothetical protein